MADHGVHARYAAGCRCEPCKEAGRQRRAKRKAGFGPDDPRHGSVNGYYTLGCRCDKCRQAVRDMRAKGLPPDDPRHGRAVGYSHWGCRCEPCRAAWDEKYRGAARRSSLKKRYGITPEEYDAMLLAQGGACASCGDGQSEGGYRLSVDHNHDTGEVRGILCNGCNAALGHLKDDPQRILALLAYLRRVSN